MEIPRTRDVITLVKGQTIPAVVSDNMAKLGWPGGQGVTWIDSPSDTFLVDYADGTYAGFMLWGSNESADQFNAFTQNQPTYKFGVVCCGTWVISTSSFEQYTLQSRMAGPLVPNTFKVGSRLRFSLRGLFTPQDEWTISGDLRAPNNFFCAVIIEAPSSSNSNYIMLQTTL